MWLKCPSLLPADGGQKRNDASLLPCRCVGQHGEVQRPGRVQLQHADPVRPREGPVHRGAGGAVRPGPQRHQQTAAAAGKTRATGALLLAAFDDSASAPTPAARSWSAISSPSPESCGAENTFQTLHLNAANSIMMLSVISSLRGSLKSASSVRIRSLSATFHNLILPPFVCC